MQTVSIHPPTGTVRSDGAQIDPLAKQKTQMPSMVNTCEMRADVFRYAWFTGRVPVHGNGKHAMQRMEESERNANEDASD